MVQHWQLDALELRRRRVIGALHTEKAPTHRQICDIRPDLIGPGHAQTLQQIGIGLVALRGLAGIGLLVDRHQTHQPHHSPDPLFVHQMAFIAQMPGHLADAKERCLKELLIDPTHQLQVQRGLAFERLVEQRPRDRQQLALLADGQGGIGWLDHFPPHFPIHDLSFLEKKLATVSSPILAWSSFTCSSSISGAFLPPRSNTPDAPSSNASFQVWDHRRMNPEPAHQLGHRLLTFQRIKSHLRLELRRMLLPFRHL